MKNFLKNKMLQKTLLGLSLAIVMIGGVFVYKAMAVASITAATGGTGVSIDTTTAGGTSAWTALGGISGPVISEGSVGEISTGVHTLTLPAGWEFNTTQNVTIGLGGGTELTLGSSVVTPGPTTLSFNITAPSTGTPAVLTFSNIQVRPTVTTTSTGNITHSGPAISGVVNGVTNFGTLSTVHGATAKVRVETAADGSGSVVASQNLTSGSTLTVYGVTRDQFNNYVGNPADTTWTLISKTGGVIDGNLGASPAANVTLSGFLVGSAVIHAVNGALTTGDSGTITVISGAANSITMDQQPAAVGTVDTAFSTQPWVIVKDANDNPVSGVDVTASLASGSGVLRGTLTVTSGADGKAKFTDLGYNKIDAFQLHFAAGALNVNANAFGPLTHGAATKYTIINPTDGTVDAAINVTVQLQDQYGNLVSTGADKDKDVTLVTDGASTGGAAVNIADGTGFLPITDHTAQTVNLSLSTPVLAGADITSTQDVAFGFGAANKIVISNPTDGTVDSDISVTIQVQDQYGNLWIGSTGGITVTTDGSAVISGVVTGTGDGSYGTNSEVITSAGGLIVVTVHDQTAETTNINVDHATLINTSTQNAVFAAGAASHLVVAAVTDPVVAGVASGITVTAKDQYNNTAVGYTGTIHFTSTDVKGTAVLPGDYTFVGGDNGIHSFAGGVTLTTSGEQTVSATDTVTGSIAGAQTAITVNAAAAAKVNVETAADGSGSIVSPQSLASGSTLTVYGITRDQYDNFVANPANTAWSLTNKTGGVVNGDLGASPAANVTLTGTLVGTGVIHAINGILTAGDSGTITITNGPATKYVITNPTDGTVDAAIVVTVQLLDANNNRVTTGLSKDTDVTLTTDGVALGAGVVDIADGVGTISISDHTAQTVNLGLSDSSSTLLDVTSTQDVIFAHGVAAKYTIINPTDGTVDAAINVTVQLQDQYGNLVSTGANKDDDVDLVASGAATGAGTVNISNGTGLLPITDHTAQTVTLTLTNPVAAVNIASTEDVIFAHGAATKYVITDPTDGTVDAAITVTVQLLDQYNNRVTSGPLTDNDVTLTTNGNATGAGVVSITTGVGALDISDHTAETVDLGLTDMGTGLNVGSTQNVIFAPGVTNHLTVTGITDPVVAGVTSGVTVTAKDQYNNTTPAYTGTAHFTSTDVKGTTVLPGDYTFVGGDNGTHTFAGGVTLTTSGEQTVSATDTVTGSITGAQTAITVNAAAASKLALSASPTSLATSANSTLTATVQDQYSNTVLTDNSTYLTFVSEGHSTWSPHGGTASSGVKTSTLTNASAEAVVVSVTSNPWLTPPADVTVTFNSTADNTPPVISLTSATTTQTTAVITFQSTETGTTYIKYGLSNIYGNTTETSDAITAAVDKTITLTGLTCGTTYHYSIYAKDAALNESHNLGDASFATNACTVDNSAPAGLAITAADATVNADYYTIAGTITADPNDVTVQILNGANVVGTVVVTAGDTTWSAVVALPQSVATTFTARATDPTGNAALSTANADSALQSVVITESITAGQGNGVLKVNSITPIKTYATANNNYDNGWSWTFGVTVPTTEASTTMKFANWVSGANTILAANNIRFYSAQSSNANSTSTAITISAANTYSDVMTINGDLDAATAGRQIEIIVESKVPTDSAGGSYSTSYGVQSN
jgi:hypothetical protein